MPVLDDNAEVVYHKPQSRMNVILVEMLVMKEELLIGRVLFCRDEKDRDTRFFIRDKTPMANEAAVFGKPLSLLFSCIGRAEGDFQECPFGRSNL